MTGTASGFPVFEALLALVVVLALLAVTLWLLRRGLRPRRAGARLAVEEGLPLGDRRSLLIVNIEGRRFVVGTAPGYVGVITELARPQGGEVSQ